MKVAVIGAGIAGISCASQLSSAGFNVTVFDKARSVGGRMTSKRTEHGYMDFGAQYFTARHPVFKQQVAKWQQQGVVSRWLAPIYQYQQQLVASPDTVQRYIGVPAMHSPLKWQARTLNTQLNCRIVAIEQQGGLWQLVSEQGEHFTDFTDVVLAMPPVQIAQLLAKIDQGGMPETALQPCWAVTLILAEETQHPAGGIFIKDPTSPLSWVSRHNAKPGRAQMESWLLHFNPAFSQLHLQQDHDFWQHTAQRALTALLASPVKVASAISHRWLYAQMNTELAPTALADNLGNGLWLAGDWLRGGRVENAWLSGYELATKLMTTRT